MKRKIAEGTRWLEGQAARFRVPLHFRVVDLAAAVDIVIDEHDRRAGPHHSAWMNTAITRALNQGRHSVASGLAGVAEGLGCSSLAVLFCVQRAGCASRSFPFGEGGQSDPEFATERAILFAGDSARRPGLAALAAHELLHLYGAIDLAPEKLRAEGFDELVAGTSSVGDDVMRTLTQRPIDGYGICDPTSCPRARARAEGARHRYAACRSSRRSNRRLRGAHPKPL